MTALLYLLRHGETDRPGCLNGHDDCAVTAEGIAACREQTNALDFDRIISSDLRRASTCADAIASPRGLIVVTDPRWRELDFGAWDGRPTATIAPAALKAFWDGPDANPPPGGERWSQLVARIGEALVDLDGGTSLIVTHGGAIRAALHVLCGFDDQRQLWAFDLPCASMLALRVWPGERPSGQILGLWP